MNLPKVWITAFGAIICTNLFCPYLFRHSKKGHVLRSKTIALYLEPRFLTAHDTAKARFHLAPMLRCGLDGMTTFEGILAIQVQKKCESDSRFRAGMTDLRVISSGLSYHSSILAAVLIELEQPRQNFVFG